MTNPQLITTPFAENGTKNIIPEGGAAEPQLATMGGGFPEITQRPINEGGIPPERADFNGILNLYGQHLVHLNKGLLYEFDQDFANSIGGYPLNARIMLANGDVVKSTIEGNTNNPNEDMTGWEPEGQDLIDASQTSFSALITTDLLEVKNPKPYQKKYVSSVGVWYTYYPDTNQPENGVTVVGKWVMDTQPAYYSSWFCESESGTDQSVGLQTGHDYATLKGRPFIVDNKIDCNPAYIGGRKICLEIRSNSETHFTVNGEIRLLPVDVPNYHLIMLRNNVDNFIITNPVLRGDRRTHIGTTGEWGHGLTAYECKNGYIHRPKIFDCWGDGLYVGRIWGEANGYRPTNVTIFEPYIEGIRRNGMAFTSGKNVNIVRPYITKVGDYDGVTGTWPRSGIDIEPEQQTGTPNSLLENCRIIDATIKDVHTGLLIYVFRDNVEHSLNFEGTTTIDGATNSSLGFFHGGSNCAGLFNFEHIVVKNLGFNGMGYAWNGASNLKLNIDKLSIQGSGVFSAVYALNGNFAEKILGNFNINAIYGDGIFSLGNNEIDNLAEYTDGSVFRKGIGSNMSMRIFSAKPMPKFAPKFFIEGETLYSGAGSTNPSKSTNIIWQDPSAAAPENVVTFNTAADFRRLKIGLSNNTTQIGQGCNISGVNLLVDGVAKTKAQCKTLGGWLEFQNVSGGRTIIYNSYGDWIFS